MLAGPSQDTENAWPLTADTMMCGLAPVTFTGSWLPSGEPFTVSPVKAASVCGGAQLRLAGTCGRPRSALAGALRQRDLLTLFHYDSGVETDDGAAAAFILAGIRWGAQARPTGESDRGQDGFA